MIERPHENSYARLMNQEHTVSSILSKSFWAEVFNPAHYLANRVQKN